MKLISVVIPTYKRTSLLAKCLEALSAQTIPDESFEIIVVSDGPDPQTENLVALFIKRGISNVRCIATAKKTGPAAARNAGWRNAAAPLIAFTDDDCLPAPRWLDFILVAYEKYPEAGAFTGRVIVPRNGIMTDYERNTAGLETAGFVTANCACTADALRRVNGFDENFAMAWREDSDLHFKLIAHGVPILPVDKAIVVHPVRPAPWGISVTEEKKGMYNALLYKKFPQLYRQKIQPERPWQYDVIVLSFLLLFVSIAMKSAVWSTAFFIIWFLFTTAFIRKRLLQSPKAWYHVTEMIATSVMIPFHSVYWRIYGAFKFKVFFV
jgi:glycosyltransferase involved in cell wall biosynthesis